MASTCALQIGTESMLEFCLKPWVAVGEEAITATQIATAAKLSHLLVSSKRYEVLETFVSNLPESVLKVFLRSEDFCRSLIELRRQQDRHEELVELIKNGHFLDGSDLLQVWDDAHYALWKKQNRKPLDSSLTRFRIRKRNPPPPSICQGSRPSRNLDCSARSVLGTWFLEHSDHPYLMHHEREEMVRRTGLTHTQVKTWFANARRRRWQQSKQERKHSLIENTRLEDHQNLKNKHSRSAAKDLSEYSLQNHDILLYSSPKSQKYESYCYQPGLDSHRSTFISSSLRNNSPVSQIPGEKSPVSSVSKPGFVVGMVSYIEESELKPERIKPCNILQESETDVRMSLSQKDSLGHLHAVVPPSPAQLEFVHWSRADSVLQTASSPTTVPSAYSSANTGVLVRGTAVVPPIPARHSVVPEEMEILRSSRAASHSQCLTMCSSPWYMMQCPEAPQASAVEPVQDAADKRSWSAEFSLVGECTFLSPSPAFHHGQFSFPETDQTLMALQPLSDRNSVSIHCNEANVRSVSNFPAKFDTHHLNFYSNFMEAEEPIDCKDQMVAQILLDMATKKSCT